MDPLENLEIFIPANAEVKIVHLRSLPSSVQRRMGSLPSASWQPADSLEGVWICPANLRVRGQSSAGEAGEEEDAKRFMWQQSQTQAGPMQVPFVTANRSAYNVLSSGMLPRRAAAAAAAGKAAGRAVNTEQDAIVVYRNRIYFAVKRRPGCPQGGPPSDSPDADIDASSEIPTAGHKRPADSPSLLPQPKQTRKNLQTEAHDAHQEAPDASNIRSPSPAAAPTSTADDVHDNCDNPAGICHATEEVEILDSAHKVPPQEAEGLGSEGNREELEVGKADEDEDRKGNPSSGDQPNAAHCGVEQNPAEAEPPNEGASSVSAHKRQVNFKALVLEEKMAQLKAKMQQQDAGQDTGEAAAAVTEDHTP